MAWSVVGTNKGAGATSIALAMPTGTASGDTIILFIQSETASTAAPTPTGYTLIGDRTNASQSMRVTAFSKVAGASEPAVTCVGGTGYSWQEPALIVLRGGASSAPVDVSSSNQGSSTAASATGVTTTQADMLVAFFINWNGGETFGTPAGFTAQMSDSATGYYLFSLAQSAAGATGTVSSTLSASDAWIAWLVAVLPAGGGTVSSGTVNMGGAASGLGATGTSIKPAASTTGANASGLAASGTSILSASTANLGIGGGGIAPPASALVLLVAPLTTLGGAGALVGTATAIKPNGASLGGAGGLVDAGSTLLIGGAVVGGASGGLVASGSGGALVSGVVPMGAPDVSGLVASAALVIRAGATTMGSQANGILPVDASVGDPNGYWAMVTVLIWRETFPGSGVGRWNLCPAAVWRAPGQWNELTT